jgi:glycosyltransferase involved in cell wall biosynthesis
MPLRILIDVRRLWDFGIGTHIRGLLNGLASLDQESQFLLAARPADEKEFRHLPANFQVVRYDRDDRDRINQITFPLFLYRQPADVYHVPVSRVPWFMPRPYVVTVHDLSALLYEAPGGTRRETLRTLYRHGLGRASAIIAVSGSTRRDLHELLDIPESQVRMVHNAPNPAFFSHSPMADARSSGPEAWNYERKRRLERYQINYPFLLYAGTIRKHKNIPRLVEAFAIAREEFEKFPEFHDIRLIIIGDEISKHPEVRRTVIQCRVENYVRFLGFVPFDTLRVFYEAASAFVFPSLYEGFGLPPLEAMASGTPVVTSRLSSMPEVVGDAALLVNPENCFDIARGIKEVVMNAGLREHLSRAGKERAAEFSWNETARQVLDIYREVAGKE